MKFRKTFIALTLATVAVAMPVKQSLAQEVYVGQIIWVGFNFCPRSFAPANGQILPIEQNQALFSLLGTTYGGDGRVTFALPDLRGRAAINPGQGPGLGNVRLGGKGGAEEIVLGVNQIPLLTETTNAARLVKGNKKDSGAEVSITEVSAASMKGKITNVSGAKHADPVNIQSPFLGIKACISVQGLYPSRN